MAGGREHASRCRRRRLDPGLGRPPGGGSGHPLGTLAWEAPRAEEPGRLPSAGL